MTEKHQPAFPELLEALQERAKELATLYKVEEILGDTEQRVEEALRQVADALPGGWRFTERCGARVTYADESWTSPGFVESELMQCVDVVVQDVRVGQVCVAYEPGLADDGGPLFLPEEVKLIETVADRISHFVLYGKMRAMFEKADEVRAGDRPQTQWQVALDLLRITNPKLGDRVARKMMNYLCLSGVDEARALLMRYGEDALVVVGESNQPRQKASRKHMVTLAKETFEVAAAHLTEDEILGRVQKWIQEDRTALLARPLANDHAPLAEVAQAMGTYRNLLAEGRGFSQASANSVRVGLIRRFFTEQLEYINVAKRFVDVDDFNEIMDRLVHPRNSHGKLGGKSAGLFLASRILDKAMDKVEELGTIKIPRTWYVTSDSVLDFIQYNELEEVYEQKYKEIDEVRQEYPHIVQVFKNSFFSSDIVKGLSMALDDLGEVPLVVRSSSLLEDRLGSAFSGKYRSLFLANQGSKSERLDALMDAIAEVYASTFGPDPIEYRAERGLLDFNEEMGIMIQEVVGQRVGRYWLPSFAGVAFSNNEFRWSPRIQREDGLLRMVPGLGTRAVDRLMDDYPVLLAPGQPNLRVNVTVDEVVRYSPKKVDVIDLEANEFVTMEFKDLIREADNDYPRLPRVVSVLRDGILQRPLGLATDLTSSDLVVTFEGLIGGTPFVRQVAAILKTLQGALGTPVDIEFASDGRDFYLLQCRPQSHSRDDIAVDIPKHVDPSRILFTARRYVSNGMVPELTHIVYVDPARYAALAERGDMVAIGRAVGRLNKLLPKRQFALMGPGRWGSRGDIQLGVQVTYSDINNTAILVEVARQKGNYVPDLSFGTHFFQDLVEASIRYLPLYPDDDDVAFNEEFLLDAPNILSDLLPECAHLGDCLRVIDVPAATGGQTLHVLMNAEKDEALAMFAPAAEVPMQAEAPRGSGGLQRSEESWRWRLRMAEQVAADLDPVRFGVVALYVFGSTKNATAGPGSDIDLIIHHRGTGRQRSELEHWLEGWSLCLAEANYLRTGYKSRGGLLDVHILGDDDIGRRTSFAMKIGAITDAARQLPVGGNVRKRRRSSGARPEGPEAT